MCRPLERPRSRQEDNIKIDVMLRGTDWILMGQNRDKRLALVTTAMKLQRP